MRTTASDEHSTGRPPTLYERRVYFKQLAGVLLDSGVKADDVGRIVAELDLHVAMMGTHPVDELGPVADVAKSFRETSRGRRLGSVLVASALVGGSLGLAYATWFFLTAPDLYADSQSIGVPFVLGGAYMGVGTRLMGGLGASSRRGRPASVTSSWRVFALYLIVGVVVLSLTRGVRWNASRSTAVDLLVASVAVALVTGLWLVWRRRVRVPGNPAHLRRLGWRWSAG